MSMKTDDPKFLAIRRALRREFLNQRGWDRYNWTEDFEEWRDEIDAYALAAFKAAGRQS
jgi:hypothetical protein